MDTENIKIPADIISPVSAINIRTPKSMPLPSLYINIINTFSSRGMWLRFSY